MALSFQTFSFGVVGVAAIVLFAHGRPDAAPQAEPPIRTASATAQTPPESVAGGAATSTGVSGTVAGLPFHNVSVELPSGDRMFPDGRGAELANANCLACHSAGMVLNQPPLSLATWTEEINKMRDVFHAPVEAADVQAIATYLATTSQGPH